MAFKFVLAFALILFVCLFTFSSSQLTPGYYTSSCPNLLAIVKNTVANAIAKEPRMGASLLRLHFHDCFVNGCDASVLLDDTPSLKGEKTALPNQNSSRGFEVVDAIKAAVESKCPAVVSCADILAIAARDSVVQLQGSGWQVNLGRRDSLIANFTAANNGSIPFPNMDLNALQTIFQQHGLDQTDLVVLSGAHTIGQARCTNFRARIYNETNIDPGFASQAQTNCPSAPGPPGGNNLKPGRPGDKPGRPGDNNLKPGRPGDNNLKPGPPGQGDNNLEPLDIQTPTVFDNKYFGNLVNKKGLLHSDQQLFNGGPTDSLVQKYNGNPMAFQADFGKSMIKMGSISPLTGTNGQIRKNCRKPN